MKLVGFFIAATATAFVGIATVEAADCPKDSVRAGTVCIDRYEASVWQIKPQGSATSLSNQQQGVVDSIRAGTVTLADLNKIGAVQLGINPTFPPELVAAGCPQSGAGCTNVYAVSLPGVKPSGYMTWFQAAAAARNSFKRLPTNAEWTVAAQNARRRGRWCDDLQYLDEVRKSRVVVRLGPEANCLRRGRVADRNVIEWVADWSRDQSRQMCTAGRTTGRDSLHGYQRLFGAAPSVIGGMARKWRRRMETVPGGCTPSVA